MDHYCFEINIGDKIDPITVKVRWQEETDDTIHYDVFTGDRLLGTIYPTIGIDTQLTWHTSDLIAQEIVNNIGKQIESKDM